MAIKKITLNDFGNGVASDYSNPRNGECLISKHFDLLTFPNRLQPLRTLSLSPSGTEPTNSKLGNMILAYDGSMYGIGVDPNNPTFGEIWQRDGFGGSDVWEQMTTRQIPGVAVVYDLLVHYPEMSYARKLVWAAANKICFSNLPGDGSGAVETGALTFSSIGQGLVHPKDKVLYFPYKTTTAHYIFKYDASSGNPVDGAGNLTNVTAQVFTLPFRYTAYCLSHFGDYLAVPLTASSPAGGVDRSVVGLWNRDTSTTTIEPIPWGNGNLKVLNNLNGVLIGVSEYVGDVSAATQHTVDVDKIQIKIYAGGAEPTLIKEIVSSRISATEPSVVINPRVNFIHNNRLYFSINVVGANSYYGLWSVGQNQFGRWTLVLERLSNNDDTATGTIAACMNGDFVTTVHTTVGTITSSVSSNTYGSTTFSTTSVWDSGINPGMDEGDKEVKKQIVGVFATYLPLPDDGTVKMYYRVDQDVNGTWQEIFTESTNDETRTEKLFDANGDKFDIGRKYEFRLTSTGGAVITGYGYKYQTLGVNV